MFKIITHYDIDDAYCKCGEKLESYRGLFETTPTMVCMSCDSVYHLKLVKLRKDKVDKKVLNKIKGLIRKRKK